MKESFEVSEVFESTPNIIYKAWLDSEEHSNMVNGVAICSSKLGGEFNIWEDYITGKNLKLVPNIEIVQSWRTSEFSDTDEDSIITIKFEKVEKGTKLILNHSNIPEGQTQYEEGWKEHYFAPMKDYFS
ncbi:MAG: SRPBCC domain-containing protein [Candidatus Kapaibacterium sp.]